MAQTTVGIRELKARLGTYMRQVKDGTILVITERGKPIGTHCTDENIGTGSDTGIDSGRRDCVEWA